MVTQARLKELLSYDAETGEFSRHGSSNVGTLREDGRLNIGVDYRNYRAHRLAWLYVYGEFPKGDIDHIDGNPLNNAIANLRQVSRSINMQNQRRARSDSKTGLLGVNCLKRGFGAEIKLPNGRKWLGRFKTAEAAHQAYIEAKRAMHEGCTI